MGISTYRSAGPSWPRTSIDHFVHARLHTEDLEPTPRATRQQLVRRLSLDLHGLPPTPESVDRFVNDPSPSAYHDLVSRMLASPRYGERMVWEWLDAARYADSNGYQADRERTMWPWRDWATQALNQNIPFDEFTIIQLAGDLLPNPTPEQTLATGFLRNHMINGEGGRIPEENRVDYVMDMAETTGTVWLGLTMNCCRCHDHKFDPISQKDYYSLFAFFNQTPVNGGGGDPQTPPVMEVLTQSQSSRRKTLRHQRERAQKALVAAEAQWQKTQRETPLSDEIQTILNTDTSERKDDQWNQLIALLGEAPSTYGTAIQQFRELRKAADALTREIPKVMVMKDRAEPRKTFVLQRGLYNQPGSTVTASTPAVLPGMEPTATKNRLGLARWLVDKRNPLTARVFVNRQWALFFGQGLVATPEDFGTQGERPSHPQLLDWLAADFVDSGWDIKRLHRQLVLSATYQQSSRITAEKREHDPENRLLSRGPRYRLPSWMIRDQALSAAGLMVGQIGGTPVKPYQPDGVWADFTFGKKRYRPDTGEALYRRSLYTFWRRIIGPTMFFDAAKRQTCVVKSSRTNTPLHALATLNDVTYVEAARALARRAITYANEPDERLRSAFRWVTGRIPDATEVSILHKRLQRAHAEFSAAPEEAQALLEEGASKPDPSLDPVEHAAYAIVCSLILNLDETLNKQ